jgi:N-glycosylase/DNA lyase
MMTTADRSAAAKELRRLYFAVQKTIEARIADFSRLWQKGTEQDLFAELAFCLFTPQSRAVLCWQTVRTLIAKDLLFNGTAAAISKELARVRFRNNKAMYLVDARRLFAPDGKAAVRSVLDGFSDSAACRDWLVHNVKGFGLKEASHFLRNIGRGENLAILDRHILRNLVLLGVIDSFPPSLSMKCYIEIEARMIAFAKRINIPLSHLDLLLWCKETGEVFK